MPSDPDTVKRNLPVKLTEAELLQAGSDLADAELDIERLKEKRSAVGAKITDKVKERLELARKVDRGTEERLVVCKWIDDFAHNARRLIRQDTGDEVEVVAMTADDRQEDMFADGDAPATDDDGERIDLSDDAEGPEGEEAEETAGLHT